MTKKYGLFAKCMETIYRISNQDVVDFNQMRNLYISLAWSLVISNGAGTTEGLPVLWRISVLSKYMPERKDRPQK